jgi:archaemetzincin
MLLQISQNRGVRFLQISAVFLYDLIVDFSLIGPMKYPMKITVFLLLILASCQKPISGQTVVALQRYKGFSKSTADTIATTLSQFYGVKVIQLHQKQIYAQAFINVKSARFRADSIIRFQEQDRKEDYIFGLTAADISTTKKDASGKIKEPAYKYADWGIMGLAFCSGNSCIVSDFRLRSKNQSLFLSRLKKVSVHEFGHNLGLPHCSNKNCVMTDAVESIATVDHAQLALCKDCKKKLNQ